MRALVWGICNNGATSEVHLGYRVPALDFNRLKSRPGVEKNPNNSLDVAIDSLPSPRLLTTHLPYRVIPKGDSESTRCKYVYIARNPLDSAVSGFFFARQLHSMWKDFPAQELEGFLKQFREGKRKRIASVDICPSLCRLTYRPTLDRYRRPALHRPTRPTHRPTYRPYN